MRSRLCAPIAWDALKPTSNGVLGTQLGTVRAKVARYIGIGPIVQNRILKPTMSGKKLKPKPYQREGKKERFAGIPHVVLESKSYIALPARANKLLLDVVYQYNGKNNGDLTVAWGVMEKRGWSSKDTLSKAVQDLVEADLILKTRTGRFMNPGARCDLYAITWQAIDECPGKDLEASPTNAPLRKFSLERSRNPSPEIGQGSNQKSGRERQRDERGRYV